MKNKTSKNYSGIVICDSITMSVKKKRPDLRRIESVFIAAVGFISVLMSFLKMFDFTYSLSAVIRAVVFFSAVHIAFALLKKKNFLFAGASLIVLGGVVYRFMSPVIKGYKYVYNVIYSQSFNTQLKYYKFLDPEDEKYCVTVFLVLCIWLLALIIYTFTIHRPNPLIVVFCTFPIIEIGLYNGVSIPVFWGILTVAYWLALLAICNTDIGEYSGGGGGFVRKENTFFPKRHMRLKVTEKCAVMLIVSICIVAASAIGLMRVTGYERSEELNQKRVNIKAAINSFTFDDLASSISAVTESFGFSLNYESHKLGATASVSYKNVTDIVVTLDKKYDGAIYLKGYSGSIYRKNEWFDLDSESYQEAEEIFSDFREYGIYPQDFPHILTEASSKDSIDITIWLEAKRKRNKSYAPYGTNDYGNMNYTNDTNVSSKKSGSSDYSYKFTGIDAWDSSLLLDKKTRNVFSTSGVEDSSWEKIISEYCTENDLYSYNDYFSVDNELNREYFSDKAMYESGSAIMAELLESRYRSFVYENYLQIPDNKSIDAVRSAFSDILDSSEAETAYEKLELLQQFRDRINTMAEYSLSPGKTPSNRDFVNYFLLENHKGYCTHYASAGVLLARMAGIPARYATGYILVGDDFNENSENRDGTYTIELKDNRSHAWAEIYLDGFGWVPFEFTAGYSDMTINTDTTTSAETTLEQTETTTADTGTKTTGSDERHRKSSASNTTASTETKTTAALTTTAQHAGHGGSGGGVHISEKVYSAIIAVATVLAFCIFILMRRLFIIWYRKKRFSEGTDAKRVGYMYEYVEKLLAFLDVKRDGLQYTEFADAVERNLSSIYFEEGEFREFVETALKCSFGDRSPGNEAVNAALEFVEQLGRNIYSRSKGIKKLYMKVIFVLV